LLTVEQHQEAARKLESTVKAIQRATKDRYFVDNATEQGLFVDPDVNGAGNLRYFNGEWWAIDL
jgi:hypothetical protein